MNEIIDSATSQTGDISLVFRDDLAVNIGLDARVAMVNVAVEKAVVAGLNSFDTFKLLLNKYELQPKDRYNFTFEHEFALDQFDGIFDLGLILGDGSWISSQEAATENAFLKYHLGLQNLNAKLATSILMDPWQLKTIQLGQLLGVSGGDTVLLNQAFQGFKCALSKKFLYAFNITNLEISVGAVPLPCRRILGSGSQSIDQ